MEVVWHSWMPGCYGRMQLSIGAPTTGMYGYVQFLFFLRGVAYLQEIPTTFVEKNIHGVINFDKVEGPCLDMSRGV